MIGPALAIARKDLQVLAKDPRGLANLFLMPAMFLIIMSLALSRLYAGAKPGSPNSVQQNVPAWTLFGIFFVAPQLASSLLEERKVGTFRRLLVAPIPRASMLFGKLLPWIVVNLVQVTLLFATGVLLLPVLGAPRLDLPRPLTLLVITLAASFSATALGLLIASLARTAEQIGGLGTLLVLTMAALGGVMVPRAVMPNAMRTAGLFVPHTWALQAYQDILVRGLALGDVLPALGALAAFATVCFAIAVALFRWE